ncbi:MAG: amino acid adenylation domain-containing protein [Oleiphilaceae bacterium]|jgi:amino acid adenylation domain-containing protein/non-ribosomal peptide synthase protein (TIGR01720 family)
MKIVDVIRHLNSQKIYPYIDNKDKLRIKAANSDLGEENIELIKKYKKGLIEFLLDNAQDKASFAGGNVIEVCDRQQPLTLSFSQQRLWFLDQFENGSSHYNIPIILKLRGKLDTEALQYALDRIVARHEILRTTYHMNGDQAEQVIHSQREVKLVHHYLDKQHQQQTTDVNDIITAEVVTPFNLCCDLMLRVKIIHCQDHWIMIITMHHIASDGWSLGLLSYELMEFYKAFISLSETEANTDVISSPLPALKIQYVDFAQWQHREFKKDTGQQQLNYWLANLADLPQVHNLPTDYPRNHSQDYQGRELKCHIDKTILKKLEKLAKELDLTPFMVLETTFALLLSRWSNTQDIVIGTPIAGRQHTALEPLMGFFVNTLVLRTQTSENISFKNYLQQQKKNILNAYSQQDIPFEMLVEKLEVERSLSYSPLFQILFSFQNNENVTLDLPGLHVEQFDSAIKQTRFDLELHAGEDGNGLGLRWIYASSLFSEKTIKSLSDGFILLLTSALAEPAGHIFDFPIMPSATRQHLLSWQESLEEYPQNLTMHELFELQVEKTPMSIALVCGDIQYSYYELNQLANHLAHSLIEQKIIPGDKIGICMARDPYLVVAILAVLKAGASYVPLDPKYPRDRLQYMADDCQMALILTQKKLQDSLQLCVKRVCYIDDLRSGIELSQTASNISIKNIPTSSRKLKATDLAYIIYTSGSTGQPKGVMIEHQSAVSFLTWAKQAYHSSALRSVLALTSVCFDLSIFEIFAPLVSGGKVVLVDGITDLLESNFSEDISLINCVPSAMKMLLEHGDIPSSVEVVNLAGEPLRRQLVDEIYRYPSVKEVYNLYGPSEDTTYSTYNKLERDDRAEPTIGRPLPNTQAYVLDHYLNPVPLGVVGELYLGGSSLARGYHNQKTLTDERFLADPFVSDDSAKIYKTGDLVRYLPDGRLVFIGRVDHQVKLRGFRIELSEIETALTRSESVQENLVTVLDTPEGQRLVAYLVAKPGIDLKQLPTSLRKILQQHLPDFMLPHAFVCLDAWPLTANGKIDHQALPLPSFDNDDNYIAPQTEKEWTLCGILQSVLGRESVGVNDDFFSIGGDSIQAMQVVSRARVQGLQLYTRDIFTWRNVAELAKRVRHTSEVKYFDPAEGEQVLLPIMQTFFDDTDEINHVNQSMLMSFPEDISALQLQQALDVIAAQHDVFRLSFHQPITEQLATKGNSKHWQTKYKNSQNVKSILVAEQIDLSISGEDEFAEKLAVYAQKIQSSLDISCSPLAKVVRFSSPKGREDRLLWIVHHLIIDGVSWRILKSDLQQVLQQIVNGEAIKLTSRSGTLQAWALALKNYAISDILQKEVAYWLTQMQQGVASLPLSENSKPITDIVVEAEFVTQSWDKNRTSDLLERANICYHTEINDLLLTALVRALADFCQHRCIRFDLEGHGREDTVTGVESDGIIGWFTTLYPVSIQLMGGDLGENIRRVKEHLRAIPNKGIGYGALRYLAEHNDLASFPVYSDVVFNYLGQFSQSQQDESLLDWRHEARGEDIGPQRRRTHKLGINGQVAEGCLQFRFDYHPQQLNEEQVTYFANCFFDNLDEIVQHCLSATTYYTPSDFPLVDISSTRLDELQKNYTLNALYPSTSMQHGLLLESERSIDGDAYITQIQLVFDGLDTEIIQQSWQVLAERHDIFRTIFVDNDDGLLLQLVNKNVVLPWEVLDYRNLDKQTKQDNLLQQLKNQQCSRFSINSAPLMRFLLIEEEDCQRLIWTHHHALLDGWSVATLFTELASIYNALATGQAPLFIDSSQSLAIYFDWLAKQNKKAAKLFWQDYLADVETTLMGLTGSIQPENISNESNHTEQTITLNESDTHLLKSLAQSAQVTLNTVCQAAWGLILARFLNKSDVVFGVTHSGRPAELEHSADLVGLLINTQVMRLDISQGEQSLKQLLQTIQKQQFSQDPYRYTALSEIQAWTGFGAQNPLFDSLLVYENIPSAYLGGEGVDGKQAFPLVGIEAEEKLHYPLCLVVAPGLQLHCKIKYRADLIDKTTVESIGTCLNSLLIAMASHLESPIWQLQVVDDDYAQRLFALGLGSTTDYPKGESIGSLFSAQANKTPDAIAVVAGQQELTYAELNLEADQLASYLIVQGVKADSLVGICLERGLQQVVTLLAILKAGGAYLPLDPAYPKKRLRHILDDTHVELIITNTALAETLPLDQKNLCCLDTLAIQVELKNYKGYKISTGSVTYHPQQLAYINYTSGSTGQPKGVLAVHQGVIRLVCNNRFVPLNNNTRMLYMASLNFDAATLELWGPLLNGGTVVIYAAEQASLEGLQDVVDNQAINTLWLTAGLFSAVSDLPTQFGQSLRYLLVGGDIVSPRAVTKMYAGRKHLQIINGYGPTENTTFSTTFAIPRNWPIDQSIPIGKAIANSSAYVLNQYQQVQPVGAIGELYVGGDGLARGYLGQDKLTQEKFVSDLFGQSRLYKTGDLVRFLGDGNLAFIARSDDQVKIRGFRIELGEIETALETYPKVSKALVQVYRNSEGENSETQESDYHKHLVAFLVLENTSDIVSDKDLSQFLEQRLPHYMLPAAFVTLLAWPLTINGKIDRKALPKSNFLDQQDYQAPRTKHEAALVALWQAVLCLERVGIDDNFFAIGGDSIQAMQVVSRGRREGLLISLQDLFKTATIRSLAATIQTDNHDRALLTQVIGEQVLLPIMHDFFADSAAVDQFNQAMVFSVPAAITSEQLQLALLTIAERHEVYRLRFPKNGQAYYQDIAAAAKGLVLETVVFADLDESEFFAQASAHAKAQHARLDISRGPLARVIRYCRNNSEAEAQDILLWVQHHLIVDGVSWRILQEDFTQVLEQASVGDKPTLPESRGHLQAWAERLQDYVDSGKLMSETDYWLMQTSQNISALPQDHYPIEGDNSEQYTAVATSQWDIESTQRLLHKANACYNTQINDLLLTALMLTVLDWQNKGEECDTQDTIRFDLEGHGREDVFFKLDSSDTVGWFTSCYPVVLNCVDKNDLGRQIRAVKEQLRTIPNKGVGFGLLKHLANSSELRALPSSSLVFNYLGQFSNSSTQNKITTSSSLLDSLIGKREDSISPKRQRNYTLGFNSVIVDGNFQLSIDYHRSHHQASTINDLSASYLKHLSVIVSHCCSATALHTPSDFPLLAISESFLASLQRTYLIDNLYPSTAMQQGLLLETDLSAGGAYMTQVRLHFDGVDTEALKQAWQLLIERHKIFRTAFIEGESGDYWQLVQVKAELPWESMELGDNSLDKLMDDQRHRPFDITQAPLMRFLLVENCFDQKGECLIWTHHHALLDGWGLSQILQELLLVYDRLSQGQALPILAEPPAYENYIAWLQQYNTQKSENYWREYLAGSAASTAPKGYPANNKSGQGCYKHHLSKGLSAALAQLAQLARVSVNTVMQSAWGLLLSRHNQSDEAVFGVTRAGRPPELAGSDSMLGLFITTHALRVPLPVHGQSLFGWLQALHRTQLEQDEHSYLSLADVQKCANHSPLFHTIMVFENQPLAALDTVDCPLTAINANEELHYPLSLVVVPGEQLECRFMYQQSELDENTIIDLSEELNNIFIAMGQHVGESVEKSAQFSPLAVNLLSIEEQARLYWRHQLKSASSKQLLRRSTKNIDNHSLGKSAVTLELPGNYLNDLTHLAAQLDVSVSSIFLSVHLKVLTTFSAQSTATSCIVNHGQMIQLDHDSVLSVFHNALPHCQKLVAGNWTDLIRDTETTINNSVKYQHYPIDNLQNEFTLNFSEVLFNFGADVIENDNYDLCVNVIQKDKSKPYIIQLNHNPEAFDKAFIHRLGNYYLQAFDRLLNNIYADHNTCSLLPKEETEDLLITLSNSKNIQAVDNNQLLHYHFEQQAYNQPEVIALSVGDKSLSYDELNIRANKLAHYLISIGIGIEDPVGICLQRDETMVIAILAVLKAGATYVPLDPEYPAVRTQHILDDCAMAGLITQIDVQASLSLRAAQLICIDDLAILEKIDNSPSENLDFIKQDHNPAKLAYIIYTSGSTGLPKGVMIEHGSAVTFLTWVNGQYSEAQLRSVLAVTSICFDLSIFELFSPWLKGGRVVLVNKILDLIEQECEWDVSLINCVPSAMKLLIDQDRLPESVITVNLAGEPLRRSLVDRLYQHPQIEQVYNLYGPSEDTTYSSFIVVSPDDSAEPSIGRPLANTCAYILDENLNLLPRGVAGDLYLGSKSLARGYFGQQTLSEEKFISNPFVEGRLYKTGDIARWLPDGNLAFLGRGDDQIKIRGFRIELGEIESAIRSLPNVEDVKVMATKTNDEQQLLAYIICELSLFSVQAIRASLKDVLPKHMVPAYFSSLEKWPLNSNGKIDYSALPSLNTVLNTISASRNYIPPRTETEKKLTGIWSDVLGINILDISINDNFFDIGGHSLKAVKMLNLTAKAFSIRIAIAQFFELKTLSELAQNIDLSIININELAETKNNAELTEIEW